MNSKLYVGNLSFKTTEEDLAELFSTHGKVLSSRIITDKDTGRSKGFAFVEMESDDAAQTAIDNLDGKDFMTRALKVNIAKPKPSTGGGPRRQNRY